MLRVILARWMYAMRHFAENSMAPGLGIVNSELQLLPAAAGTGERRLLVPSGFFSHYYLSLYRTILVPFHGSIEVAVPLA